MHTQYNFDNLSLKVLSEKDAPMVLSFCLKNRSTFEYFELKKPKNFYTLDFQRAILHGEWNYFTLGQFVRFYLFDQNYPDQIIGTVSFTDIKKEGFYSCQTGYKIDQDFVRKGYGYKMLSNAIVLMEKEHHMHRISAYILPQNEGSIHLAEKSGFVLESISKDYAFINDHWADHFHYVYLSGITTSKDKPPYTNTQSRNL